MYEPSFRYSDRFAVVKLTHFFSAHDELVNQSFHIMAAEEKGSPESSFSPDEQERLLYLQLDLNDLQEKLGTLKNPQEQGQSGNN